ncbi:TetR/AcrR family transcriptional regulator [Psittacicella gerlachiana]|uniref:HTH tetR-type domain-containing protein n=1 Tax=Psittacicella gerlachiana TaxID=2028574 RepID=A0A3A1YH68_9GAMM|nr:TetR/AcrR family transcriptional regulator [Psittacicella gerlachiana]RIY36806.1 hypothetical protein CKF59_02260 [Psittacicella gerlachiana]
MARPLCAEKRKSIILSAIHLFYNEGFNAPTSKIAREAKVSEGTIFTYFKNKQDLLEKVFLFLKNDLYEKLQLSDEISEETCIIETFKTNFHNYIDYGLNYPERSILVSRFLLSKQIPLEYIQSIHDLFSQLISFIDLLRTTGPLKDVPLDLAINIFTNMGNNVIHYCIIHNVDDRDLIDEYAKVNFEAAWLALTGESVEATRERFKAEQICPQA